MKIPFAKIDFKNGNAPISIDFDDIYYDIQNGLEESEFVFFQHNNISERFKESEKTHTPFVIIETGFGTGLNFLIALNLYIKEGYTFPLEFISFEAFPIKKEDLSQILTFPALSEEITLFLSQYENLLPQNYPETRSLTFLDGKAKLSVFYGDIQTEIKKFNGIANAFFLDGHAPDKNPQMWTDEVLIHLGRLSQEGTTLATFTSVGRVRRSLIAQGFQMEKVKGHGKKREMLKGTFKGAPKCNIG